ncbi:hypothetical protein EH120_02245 [Salmonella enterica subsp. enterica]|nr:hypothetical protein [Salmonella enterica subsp. enterica]
MTKPASTSKTPRKQYTPEFRDEALKLAERIGGAAAARELFSSREIMRATVFNYIECDYNRCRRHSA